MVGAPATAVDGVANAGALYSYDHPGADPVQLRLASSRKDGNLGRGLGLLRFWHPGETTPREIVAAAGLQSLYLFFADPVSGKNDVRVP